MSNFPTIEKTLENLLNSIITLKPPEREAIVKPALQTFISHPLIQTLLNKGAALSPKSTPSKIPDLADLQKTLTSLSKALEGIQKPSTTPSKRQSPPTQSKDKSKLPPHSYSAVVGSRPPNPSLVVDLADLKFDASSRPKPEAICCLLNEELRGISPPQVQLAAVRWTASGNLVVTGGPAATSSSLQLAAPHIGAILSTKFKLTSPTSIPPPRANVKWSKIIINGVPTEASSARNPYTPEECHAALSAINPSYATLSITQQPSWVRPPSSYSHGSASSLSVAFEDQSGEKLKAILAERYLYLFGNRATVKKWKYRRPSNSNKETSSTSISKHPQVDDSSDKDAEPPKPPAAKLSKYEFLHQQQLRSETLRSAKHPSK